MTDSGEEYAEYVQAALLLQDLALTDAQRTAVARQFALLASMAELFKSEPLSADSEPAPVFRL